MEVTIGQYYPENSIIHRLDPRVKLFGTVIFLVVLFINNNFVNYILITLFLAVVLRLSKVPVKLLFKGLKSIFFILLISVLFMLFFTPGTVIFKVAFIKITKAGIKKASFYGIRILYLVICTSIMTLTTTPNDLADGMEKALFIFSKIGIPVHEISMIISIALRFIPILMEETEKITMAQKARGAKLDEGNFIKRLKNMVPILVPLFMSAIRRAIDMADAMEARCYNGGKGRTKMKPLKHHTRDFIGYGLIIVSLFAVIGMNVIVGKIPQFAILIMK